MKRLVNNLLKTKAFINALFIILPACMLTMEVNAQTTVKESTPAQQITLPKLTGPVPITTETGEPYRGNYGTSAQTPIPAILESYGYVEEEYFISGTVDEKPYKTSILVRKPKDPAKFSGAVTIETIHMSGGLPFWGLVNEALVPAGHAWIAVASQRMSLNVIKQANPARYESLQIPAASAQSQNMMNMLTGGADAKISQAILTQIGALVKSNLKDGPLSGLNVKYLVMGGESQTGMVTLGYIKEANPTALMPDGKPIYDGFFPQAAFLPEPISGGQSAVIHAVGEGDFTLFKSMSSMVPSNSNNRNDNFGFREDSDAPNDRYRYYQYPGVAHVPTRGMDNPQSVVPFLTATVNDDEKLSQIPTVAFYKGAFVLIMDWVTKGITPPHAPPIEMVNGVVQVDEFGNAKGGVRSPYFDMPTARYIASAPITGQQGQAGMMRAMLGLEEKFPADKLKSLYKSRTKYLKAFNKGIDKMVAERWIMAEDGKTLKEEEAENPPF